MVLLTFLKKGMGAPCSLPNVPLETKAVSDNQPRSGQLRAVPGCKELSKTSKRAVELVEARPELKACIGSW